MGGNANASEDVSSCACGRKSNVKGSNCVRGNEKSRCTCVMKGKSCTRKCRCRTCQNKEPNLDEVSNQLFNFKSCADVGQRTTKCPCFLNSRGCAELCCCKRCHNSFSTSSVMEPDVSERASRQIPRHSPYTRRRGQHFLD